MFRTQDLNEQLLIAHLELESHQVDISNSSEVTELMEMKTILDGISQRISYLIDSEVGHHTLDKHNLRVGDYIINPNSPRKQCNKIINFNVENKGLFAKLDIGSGERQKVEIDDRTKASNEHRVGDSIEGVGTISGISYESTCNKFHYSFSKDW